MFVFVEERLGRPAGRKLYLGFAQVVFAERRVVLPSAVVFAPMVQVGVGATCGRP